MDLDGHSNIKIEDFDIGYIETKNAVGIFMPQNCRNITIRNCEIHDIKVAAPYLVGTDENPEQAGEANAILALGEGGSDTAEVKD